MKQQDVRKRRAAGESATGDIKCQPEGKKDSDPPRLNGVYQHWRGLTDGVFSLGWLWKFCKPYFWPSTVSQRIIVWTAWLCIFMSQACSAVIPLLKGRILDAAVEVTSDESVEDKQLYLAQLCIIFGICRFSVVALQEFHYYLQEKVRQNAAYDLTQNVFSWILYSDYSWLSRQVPATLAASIDAGIQNSHRLVSTFVAEVLPSVGNVVFSVYFCWTLNHQFRTSFVLLTSIVLYLFISTVSARYKVLLEMESSKKEHSAKAVALDTLNGIDSVRANCSESFMLDVYVRYIVRFFRKRTSRWKYEQIANTIQRGIVTVCTGLVLYWAVMDVAAGEMSLGRCTSLFLQVEQSFAPLHSLRRKWSSVEETFASMKRMQHLLWDAWNHTTRERFILPAHPEQIENVLEVHNLTVKEDLNGADPVTLVDNISLTVQRKEFVAIIGDSGSGKSMFLQSILGMKSWTKGRVRWFGIDTSPGCNLHQWVTYIPPHPHLFRGITLAQNIIMGRQSAEETDEDIRKRMSYALAAAQLPQNFCDPCDSLRESAAQEECSLQHDGFSSGEVKRIAIARGFWSLGYALVADELTANLDGKASAGVFQKIRHVVDYYGMSAIIVTHNVELARRVCDEVYIMESGCLSQV